MSSSLNVTVDLTNNQPYNVSFYRVPRETFYCRLSLYYFLIFVESQKTGYITSVSFIYLSLHIKQGLKF
jgi:hypothetical protein